MDFSSVDLTEAQQQFQDEVRAFLDEHLTEEVYAGARERTDHFDEGLWLAMGTKGWLQPRWKKEDGGADLDDISIRILEMELRKRDAPVAGGANDLIWPAVDAHGVPDLKAELKPQVADGHARFALGYSEPDGGSDIANAKTRAERDGDEWVINGAKIFTTSAQNCTHVFLITRTDPTLPKHKGLTMFLVPTSSPGFERQPLPTIADETTNISYYSDIRLPDRYRIGEVNNGWATLHGPLDAEHHLGEHESKLEDVGPGAGLVRPLAQSVEAAVRWAQDAPAGDGPLAGDAVDHLLVERDAGAGGEGDADPGRAVALEERDGAAAGVERLDGAVDLDGADAGPGHVAADAQRLRHDLAGLAHQADLAHRLEFGRQVRVRSQHRPFASVGMRRSTFWYIVSIGSSADTSTSLPADR